MRGIEGDAPLWSQASSQRLGITGLSLGESGRRIPDRKRQGRCRNYGLAWCARCRDQKQILIGGLVPVGSLEEFDQLTNDDWVLPSVGGESLSNRRMNASVIQMNTQSLDPIRLSLGQQRLELLNYESPFFADPFRCPTLNRRGHRSGTTRTAVLAHDMPVRTRPWKDTR